MRSRIIKADFWTDEKIVRLSRDARLLFIGLWQMADDEGRMEWSELTAKLKLFPADALDLAPLCAELRQLALVCVYEVKAKYYLQVTNFKLHQKFDARRESKFPAPDCADARHLPAQTGANLTQPNQTELLNQTEREPRVPRPPREKKMTEDERTVLDYLNAVRGSRGFSEPQEISGALKRGASVEDCKLVIDYFKAESDARPESKKYFDNSTPFRESNFQRYLNQADDWDKAGRSAVPQQLPKGVYISPNANLPNANARKENPTEDDIIF